MSTDEGTRRIVVGVDGSEASIAALRTGWRLAQALGAGVDVVACWNVPTAVAVPYALGTIDLEHGARDLLEETVNKAFDGHPPAGVAARLVRGTPRQALLDASDGAEILVVGRRGRGGFPGLLLGSVSQAVIAHARCPVLVMND